MLRFLKSNVNHIILLLFFALGLVGICRHELWLDEAHHFLLAKDSEHFGALLYACRNEGHPLLWNVLLFILTRFSDNFFYMQLLHLLISCFTVMLICKSRLKRLEKIFIIFGFYILYEYTIISRNYGLSAFFLLFLIQKYLAKKENIILLSATVFLFANTHLFSFVISLAFVFTYLIYHHEILKTQSKKNILLSLLILLTGWGIAVYCIVPPQNYGFTFIEYDTSSYSSSERILKTLSASFKGLFYIPDYTIKGNYYENSYYFISLHLSNWQLYALSIAALIIPAFIFKNNRFALTLFFIFSLLFSSIYFFLPLNAGIRYFGFFYLVFIACYWIARPNISKFWSNISLLIFFIQFINGIFMYSLDYRYPFSESKNVTNYLEALNKKNEPVFILNSMSRPAISVYSGKKYFGVENGEYLSYCLLNTRLPDSVLRSKLAQELSKTHNAYVVSNYLPANLVDTNALKLLKIFNSGITRSENVSVYLYSK